MKKLSLIFLLVCVFSLCSCQKQEPVSVEQIPETEEPVQPEKAPPINEPLRGTIANGKLYLSDGYATISAIDGWELTMVYEYSTRLVSSKSSDMLTIGILHDPDGRDKFDENTKELKEQTFKNVFNETEFISFEKIEENGIKKISSVCKVTENQSSCIIYEYKMFINTDIYTLSYYVYGDDLTEDDVKTNASSFEYLGQIK
ncbi:MAG: hypothetical protein DBX47_06595 [Clostridiales bacterium]|nr:MAG: hypothetical protein DBX47_06595 [Clostridiales bacterium]